MSIGSVPWYWAFASPSPNLTGPVWSQIQKFKAIIRYCNVIKWGEWGGENKSCVSCGKDPSGRRELSE